MEGCIFVLVLMFALAVVAATAAANDGSLGAKQEPTLNFKVKSLASCLVNRDGQNVLDRWSACLESMKENEQLEESHTSDGNELDVYVNRQGDIRGKIAGAFAQAQQVIANDVGVVFFRGFSYAKSLIGTRDPISNSSSSTESSAEDRNASSEVADYAVQESKEISSLESAALGPEAHISPEAQGPNEYSMGNLEDEVFEHQLNLQKFETDKLDEEDVIMVPESRFSSNTEVPIQDEAAGDESRKSLLLPFVVSAFMGIITALLRKNSKRNKIARISKGEHSALCMPLGFALATTFAEVLRVDSCGPQVISKDELVELLEITMKNALFPVLDVQCGPFIDNMMKSFTMSYNTITSAQCLREKRIRGSGASVKDCNSSQDDEDVKVGRVETSRLDKVVEVKTEDSSVLSPEQLHKLDQVHGTVTTLSGSGEDEDASQELVQKFQHLSIGDVATMNQQPRMGDIMLSSALSSASRTSHHSTSGAIHLFERYVVAQERRNCIKYMGLIEKERRTSMKEEQLQLTSEANTLMKENVEVSRSKFAFRRLEAHNQSLAATCSDLSSRCGDDFVAGLLIMGFSMVYCARKHCPVWLSELWTICQPDYKAKPTYSWQYMSWFYNVLEVYIRASLCVIKGTLGIVIGVVSFVTLAYLLFKMSTPSQSMPATIVVVIGGGLVGFAGKMTVELLGGNGLHWLIVWELLCCVHAFSNYFTASLVYLLHGSPDKTGRRRYYAVRRFAFHAALGYILPALAGLIAFPKVLESSGLLQLPAGILL